MLDTDHDQSRTGATGDLAEPSGGAEWQRRIVHVDLDAFLRSPCGQIGCNPM
jgi:hypothetical protein